MSVIKLLARFYKEEDEETKKKIDSELEIEEIIQGDKFDKENEYRKLYKKYGGYDYLPIIFDLKDVMMVNKVDDKHTCIRFYTGPVFTFLITLEEYEALYSTFEGVLINDFTNTKPDLNGAS